MQPDDPAAANNLAYLMIEHGGDKNIALSLAANRPAGLAPI